MGPGGALGVVDGHVQLHTVLEVYDGAFDSGLTSVGVSGWCERKMAEASDMGMMQRALD